MAERAKKAPGIADYRVSLRKRKVTFLDEIDRLIDWKPLERLMNKRLKRCADAVGNPAYPALLMFKVLLLQRWYNLSDEAVEESLIDPGTWPQAYAYVEPFVCGEKVSHNRRIDQDRPAAKGPPGLRKTQCSGMVIRFAPAGRSVSVFPHAIPSLKSLHAIIRNAKSPARGRVAAERPIIRILGVPASAEHFGCVFPQVSALLDFDRS